MSIVEEYIARFVCSGAVGHQLRQRKDPTYIFWRLYIENWSEMGDVEGTCEM